MLWPEHGGFSMKSMGWFFFATLGISAGLSTSTFSMPLGQVRSDLAPEWAPLDNGDYRGIVALDDCSGSLVRTPLSKPTDPALVLTNGHCYEGGFIQPGQVVTHQESSRQMNLFTAANPNSGTATLRATQVLYATMTKTDITLYELDQTFTEIQSRYGVEPLLITADHPAVGAAIQVISGYWQKTYSCQIDKFIYQLREGGWTSLDSIRYSEPGCETIPGTSGSPVVDAKTHVMLAINNTGNESGGKCTEDNPCEVDAQGNITYQQGWSYGQEVYWINTCLNGQGKFDLTTPGCALPQS